ncbi:hypothetical protein BGZ96_000606 [Linnemannia gamsii]|uniref:Uncharacterized protein n=1 Tax=Linnemannia gamsii TaxID=64522 RepID=A0ABQ7JNR2_9FUNG|nr:hypothetical protein BGZ96_000606 [Linnemannia gamsii]
MVYYNTSEFEKFFQDPPSIRGFKRTLKPRNHANGTYHGLEFHDAGTNAVRIYLAAQFLESDWVQTLHDNSEYGHHSFARDGDVFATLARQVAESEPCLQNVTGEALFWMYDNMVVKYGQVHSIMAFGRRYEAMQESKLLKFAQELYSLDESFLEAKLKSGDQLEVSERRRAEKIARMYPMVRMDSIQGVYRVPAFGGHWPPKEDRDPAAGAAPAAKQKKGPGQAKASGVTAARQQHAAVASGTHDVRDSAATSHTAAAVAASGPAPAVPPRAVGPVRNVGAGVRIWPIFIKDFDDSEGQVIAAPAAANSRAASRAKATRPY